MATSRPRTASARRSAPRPKREAMSRVDTAWLRMERPTNPMMITGVLMFDEAMSLQKLKRVIQQRFLSYPRFLQKPVEGATGSQWVEDATFDLDWHVRLSGLPGKTGHAAEKKALERFASQLASSPLDPTKPLWQFHLVERYQGGSALVARIHHCYADGIALVQVLLSLTDTSRTPSEAKQLDKAWLKHEAAPVARRMGAMDRYLQLGGKVLEQGMALYHDPSLPGVIAKEGGELARELMTVLALPDDPPSLLRGRLGVSKRVSWAEPLSLEEVKAVGRACGCTVNDVLMAAAAGALRGYMLDRGEDLEGLTLRATVPVNLRPLEHAKKLGNHFGLVFLELPVGEDNPLRRVERITECMNQLKDSRQAIVAYGLLAALGMAPPALLEFALEMFSRKASAVATNVPGPQQPLYMAGCTLREMMCWVPQTGSIGLGLSIMSYRGQVHFGLISDARLIPDPDAVVRRFGAEFEKLLYLALMGNWDETLDAASASAMLEASTAA